MMKSEFQKWFYSLPIWNETDNYIYFAMAMLLAFLLDLEPQTKTALTVAIVTALVVKGKGNGKTNGD